MRSLGRSSGRSSVRRFFNCLTAGLVFGVVAPMSQASDGVIEINQAKALAGGVSANPSTGCSDAVGFPVTICSTGSYVLTSNLDLSVTPDPANTSAIEIDRSDVTIDLGGFAILGTTVCTGSEDAISCSPTGSGSGIRVSSSPLASIRVMNGTVRGVGNIGVQLSVFGAHMQVSHVRAVSNGGTGIVADSGEVLDCTAQNNGGGGISATNSVVVRNRVENNKGSGITAFSQSVVRENVVRDSGSIGIYAEGAIIGNTSLSNKSHGISSLAGSTLSNNTSRYNNGIGIATNAQTILQGNVSSNNTGIGINMGSPSGYGANLVSGNSGGTVVGGIETGTNICNNSTTCP